MEESSKNFNSILIDSRQANIFQFIPNAFEIELCMTCKKLGNTYLSITTLERFFYLLFSLPFYQKFTRIALKGDSGILLRIFIFNEFFNNTHFQCQEDPYYVVIPMIESGGLSAGSYLGAWSVHIPNYQVCMQMYRSIFHGYCNKCRNIPTWIFTIMTINKIVRIKMWQYIFNHFFRFNKNCIKKKL